MRREISQIGDDRHERTARITSCPRLGNLAVEMGNHGNKQVRRLLLEVANQQLHHWPMEKTNGCLQNPQELRRTKSPTVPQKRVVLLLDANTSEFAQYIKLVGKLLKLDQIYLPRTILLADYRL